MEGGWWAYNDAERRKGGCQGEARQVLYIYTSRPDICSLQVLPTYT